MSFARYGPDSDVYVYEGSDGFRCDRCPRAGEWFCCETVEEMVTHLLEHRKRGDRVPEDAITGLRNYQTST
jgi:hypothetical protein